MREHIRLSLTIWKVVIITTDEGEDIQLEGVSVFNDERLFIIKGKVRAQENIYRWVSVSWNERLNSETEGSKTPHIHWVEGVNI
jgi:hypothetical protein